MPPRELRLSELRNTGAIELEPSSWFAIDAARIRAFAEATEDRQWIHVDEERARAGPYGGTIAHGYLTLSLVPKLLAEILVVADASATINYGLDRLRFLAPVPAGSDVRLRAELMSTEERKTGVLYRLRLEVEIRGGERPALVAEALLLAVG